MPRPLHVTPLTRRVCEALERLAEGAPARSIAVPRDDREMLRFQRVIEKARQSGQLPKMAADTSPEMIEHAARVLAHRQAWGTAKNKPEVLPLFLWLSGEPINVDVAIISALPLMAPLFHDEAFQDDNDEEALKRLRATETRSHKRGMIAHLESQSQLDAELADAASSDFFGPVFATEREALMKSQEASVLRAATLAEGLAGAFDVFSGEGGHPDRSGIAALTEVTLNLYGVSSEDPDNDGVIPDLAEGAAEAIAPVRSVVAFLDDPKVRGVVAQEARRLWEHLPLFGHSARFTPGIKADDLALVCLYGAASLEMQQRVDQ